MHMSTHRRGFALTILIHFTIMLQQQCRGNSLEFETSALEFVIMIHMYFVYNSIYNQRHQRLVHTF